VYNSLLNGEEEDPVGKRKARKLVSYVYKNMTLTL
jgi:hypothetical protein